MVQSSNPRNPLTDKSPPWGGVDQPGADWQSGRSKLPVSSDLARKGVGSLLLQVVINLTRDNVFVQPFNPLIYMVD